ncbi:MAG: DISARM system phospholipase D-like protein DrmC [Dermatophilaceae bacterium]
MTGDPGACRELAAYLTGSEAKDLADRLADGETLARALDAIAHPRRATVRGLLEQAGVCAGDALGVAVLRAVEGAHSHATSITPVWTAPGNLAQRGHLTSAIERYVTGARASVVCATYNFQRSSALWDALVSAAGRPEVEVRVYVDARAADAHPRAWSPTTAQVAEALAGATVLRTRDSCGAPVRTHAKFVAVDSQYLLVTSANFSKSAEQHNVELGLLIENRLLTEAVQRQMRQLEAELYEVVSHRS